MRHRLSYALVVLGLWLWGAGVALAEGRGVHVRPGEAELLEARPREIVTTTFRVTNQTGNRREFLAQVKLPTGWKPITAEFPFELEPGRTEVRLVSFLIPRTTLAGKYQVTYLAQDRVAPSVSDLFTINVVVAPVEELGMQLLDAPKTVIAGDAYRARFVVANQGNAPARIELSVRSANQLPAALDTESCVLDPAESRTIIVAVKTNPELRREMRHSLKLTATALGAEKGGVRAEARSTVDIVPRISDAEDPYHRFPVQLALRSAFGGNGQHTGGFQAEVSGQGPLDDEGKAHIEFLFRGPDLTDKSVYGPRDEHRVSFVTRAFGLYLGDRAYALTPLTELQTFGRGAEAKLTLGELSLGGYHAETRWEEPSERQTAAYIHYQLGDRARLGLNYLSKRIEGTPTSSPTRTRPEGDVVSLRGQFKPFQDMAADIEFGVGRDRDGGNCGSSSACRAEVEGSLGKARYQLRLIHAGPDFPGYYSDVSFLSASFGAPLWGRLGVHADYRREQDNLDRDPARGSAPLDTCRRIGLDYRFATGTVASIECQSRSREDRLPSPQFHDEDQTIGFTLAHQFNALSVSLSTETGKTRDHLAGTSAALRQYRLSTHFSPSGSQSYSVYVEHRDDGGLGEEKRRSLTGGATASWRVTDRTVLVLAARTTDYEQAVDGGRDVFELRVSHLMANRAQLCLSARHTSWRGADDGSEPAVMLEYRMPLGVPLRRKKSVGALRGRVYDEQTGRGIPNTVLRLNGAAAVSDRNGHYVFPAVKPGNYYLSADRRNIEIDKVPNHKMPRGVAVVGGRDTSADIGFVPGATLSGRVALYRLAEAEVGPLVPADTGDGTDAGLPLQATVGRPKLVEAGGVPNIVVELSDGLERLRCLTDANGRFSFGSVRPGKWALTVEASALPVHHHLEAEAVEVHLRPKQAETILFRVIPKSRPIRVIQNGGVLLEEPKQP